MPYPELLALIDTKIARLRQARELLSTSVLSEIAIEFEMPEPISAPIAARQAAAETLPVAAAPMAEETLRTVNRIMPRLRRERRVVSRARQVEITALRGHLPTGPVFVPAMRVLKPENAAGQTATAVESFEKGTDMPTAAQLTQRWLHASS